MKRRDLIFLLGGAMTAAGAVRAQQKAMPVIVIVTGAQGQRWYEITVTGQEAHAGPTPMKRRRDALVGGARMIDAVNKIGHAHAPHACATVGFVQVSPTRATRSPAVFFHGRFPPSRGRCADRDGPRICARPAPRRRPPKPSKPRSRLPAVQRFAGRRSARGGPGPELPAPGYHQRSRARRGLHGSRGAIK